MFGVLLSKELSKLAQELPQPIGGQIQRKPAPITPPGGYPPAPVTPNTQEAPFPKMAYAKMRPAIPSQQDPAGFRQYLTPPKKKPISPLSIEEELQAQSNFNPGYNKMASQESTMNMFGVLVNMELQKLAQEAPVELPSMTTFPTKKPDLKKDVNDALDKARKARKPQY